MLYVMAADICSAPGRVEKPCQQLDRGRLARAVRTQKGKELPFRNIQGKRIKGCQITVAFSKVLYLDHLCSITSSLILDSSFTISSCLLISPSRSLIWLASAMSCPNVGSISTH